ncbi:hypothetical protein Pan3_18 [Pseudanabaena phage Pan3]|nr:hypothetical protein Pan3_18 [Pseudanabaena phage Pan3]
MSEQESGSEGRFSGWLAANLWGVVSFVFLFGAGYATVNWRISAIEDDVLTELADIKRILAEDRRANTCQVRTLDKLVDRAGIEPPCEIGTE